MYSNACNSLMGTFFFFEFDKIKFKGYNMVTVNYERKIWKLRLNINYMGLSMEEIFYEF